MKFLHLADLHLGKKVNGFRLIEDQRYILKQVLETLDQEKIDCVLLAGDIYDSAYPPESAVELLSFFITELVNRSCKAVIIGGNHDSLERLGFASDVLAHSGIHFVTSLEKALEPVVFHDDFGSYNVWALPYFNASSFNLSLDIKVHTSQEALDEIVKRIQAKAEFSDASQNILMAHLFVTHQSASPESSDSERLVLGTLDNVEARSFEGFDYVALGHLHKPQKIARDTIRYSGSPLMYSFSELASPKRMIVVKLEDQSLQLNEIALKPLYRMQELSGSLDEIVALVPQMDEEARLAYTRVTLTDELEPLDALETLKSYFPHLMILRYDNARTRAYSENFELHHESIQKDYFELFSEFFELQNGQAMSDEQAALAKKLYTSIREDEI
ncbi:MAG: exonuclease SbcCD subunit D [Coriobacteriia bacterium]|nr:exonuclease SbcCD subunit D [Coriobacteriia bacterium]